MSLRALARSGKAPAALILRLISPCSRSRLLVDAAGASAPRGTRRTASLPRSPAPGPPRPRAAPSSSVRRTRPGASSPRRVRMSGRSPRPHAPRACVGGGGPSPHITLQMDRTPSDGVPSCQACVLIGDHELDTAEAAVLELLEELRPALLRLLSAQRDPPQPQAEPLRYPGTPECPRGRRDVIG